MSTMADIDAAISDGCEKAAVGYSHERPDVKARFAHKKIIDTTTIKLDSFTN